jgi:hypothetical protein
MNRYAVYRSPPSESALDGWSADDMRKPLVDRRGAIAKGPMRMDGLSVFMAPAPGAPFRLIGRFPLSGG